MLAKTQDFSKNPRFWQKPKMLANKCKKYGALSRQKSRLILTKTQDFSKNPRFQQKSKILIKTQDISESYFGLNRRKTQHRTFFGRKNLKNKKFYFYFLQLGGLLVDFHGVRDAQKIVAPPKTRIRCFSTLRTSIKT